MAELGIVAREDQIAVPGEFGRAGEGVAMHLRDSWLADRPQALPTIDNLVQVDAIAADGEAGPRLLRALQIIAGAKRATGAADDQDARLAIGLEFVQYAIDLAEQFG